MTLTSPLPPASDAHALHPLICLPLHNTDMATGCMLLLMLLTTVLTSTGAVPVPGPLPGARGCHLAQFKSLSPQELKVFKRAKDALVSLPTAPPAVG